MIFVEEKSNLRWWEIFSSWFVDSSPWSQFWITKIGHLFPVQTVLYCANTTFESNSYLQIKDNKQWFELLVLSILLNHLKNLEEPEWKKYGTPLQSC